MVVAMTESEQRKWTRKDSEDASRLLAGLVRRAKKASGGQRPEQIADAPEERTSSAGEKADGGERFGEIANSNHRPHVIAGGRDDRCDRSLIEGMETPVASAGGVQRMGS